jgi:hypothetical protein
MADDDRVSRLAEDVAVLKQRSDDHEHDIRAFGPLVTEHAVLEERLTGQQRAIDALRDKTTAIFKRLDDHDQLAREREREDRKTRWTNRLTLAGLAIAFAGLMFTAVTVLANTGGHP